VHMLLWMPKRVLQFMRRHSQSFDSSVALCASKVSIRILRPFSALGATPHSVGIIPPSLFSGTPSRQNPPTPTNSIHSISPISTKIKTNKNPRILTGPQSYLYPLSQLTIFPHMSCVVAEPHVVLTEKEGRHYHYPYSGICGAVRLGLGPIMCEVHTKVRTKVCAKSENLRRNQLKGAEQ
jgi:hypothetical protein